MSISMAKLNFKRYQHLPIILQDEIAECGHACVAMIGQYFGHQLGLSELRKRCATSAHGVTLRHIKQLLMQLNFSTRALRLPLEALKQLKTPAVLHWNMNHFVVLKKMTKNKAIIHDPAVGIRHLTLQELSQSFTGIALEIEPVITFETIREQKKLRVRDLMAFIPGQYRMLGLLLFLSLLTEILALLNPFFVQYATDQAIGSNTLSNVYTVAVGFLLCMMLLTLTDYTRNQLILFITTHFKACFSTNIFKHLLTLPTAFFEARHQGDIQAKFQSVEQIQTKISTDFVNIILDGLLLILNVVAMYCYSRFLTSIVLGILGLSILCRYLSYQSLKHRTAASIHLHAKMASFFLETLRVITPIKLFLKEETRFQTWYNGYIDALNADTLVTKQHILYRITHQGLMHIENVIVICVGIQLVLNHQFTLGMLIAFLTFRTQLVNKAFSFIQYIFDYRLISVQLSRLSDIIFQEPEPIQQKALIVVPHDIQGMVTVDNISFQYHPDDKPILKHISFHVSSGERVAIIGPSGCGKTTLLKILLGLLQPTEGKILIDNIPLLRLGTHYYRTFSAAVMQYDSLLSGSILDNITFFDDQIDIQQVHEACQLAQIHKTIEALPMGYETRVGEMGSSLSGGQRQRLLLARALYQKPRILFMDEATNHLDPKNESLINKALSSLNITQIMVAHRPETIRLADRVIQITG